MGTGVAGAMVGGMEAGIITTAVAVITTTEGAGDITTGGTTGITTAITTITGPGIIPTTTRTITGTDRA